MDVFSNDKWTIWQYDDTSLVNLVIRAVTTPTTIPVFYLVSKEDIFSPTYGKPPKGDSTEAEKSHQDIRESDCLADRHVPGETLHHFVENLVDVSKHF